MTSDAVTVRPVPADEAARRILSSRPLPIGELLETPAPPIDWVWEGWLQAGIVSSIYGPGGGGKTRLMMQVAIAIAALEQCFGHATSRGRVLFLACEDSRDELHRRLQLMAGELQPDELRLERNYELHARAGLDNTLLVETIPDRKDVSGEVVLTTPLYWQLENELELAEATGHPFRLVVIDNIAQTIAVNENSRAAVTQAVNLLSRLALRFRCAVVLIGHPSKAGDSEYSGSTAWSNAVRMRMFLEVDAQDPAEVVLKTQKTNNAKRSEIRLRLDGGIFRRTDGPALDLVERVRRESAAAAADGAVLAAIRYLNDRRIWSREKKTAPNYLRRLMREHGLMEGTTDRAVDEAIVRMLGDQRIALEDVDRDSSRHKVRGLVAHA